MRIIIRLILKWFFKAKLYGMEQLKFNGPTLIMPNHVSFLDAVILYAYLPGNVCYVVNTAIAKKFSIIIRHVNHVTLDPLNPYSLKKVISLVKNGTPVAIFPEGRITTTGALMKVYNGVGLIALKTGATIYPMTLLGPELSKLSRIKDRVNSKIFPEISIHIHLPIKLDILPNQSFKRQKLNVGDRILDIMQNNKFSAFQQREKYTNLFDKLVEAAKIHGSSRMVMEDISGSVTYKKSIIASYLLGDKFSTILKDEETAGVLLPNSIGHFVALFALFYTGKTPAILNFTAGISNNKDCVEAAGVKTIITSRTFIEKGKFQSLISQLEQNCRIIYLEDVKSSINSADKVKGLIKKILNKKSLAHEASRVILFTSGSENKPKGVVLKHTNIMANINQISCVIDLTHRDKMLNALPMFHSFGLTAGTLLPVFTGVKVFLYPTPLHYKVIPELAYDWNATMLLGTPTFLSGYAKHAHPYDFYSMRYVIAGGEKLKQDVKDMWLNKFGIRVLEGYGTTETSPVLSVNTPLFYRGGTVGKFLPGIKWKTEAVEGIENGGNLLVKGPNVMEGYLIHGKGFVPASEWYNCGDIVHIDSGFITIKARLKRFAKVSGEMISLDAVESIAAQCFGIDSNAAISVADDKKGEKILLYTIKKDAGKQELREYISRTGQSMLAMPAEIIILDKLPLLGSGKTDYVTLSSNNKNGVK